MFDLLKPADAYFLDCGANEADDTRTDRSSWYKGETFLTLSTIKLIVKEAFDESILAYRIEDLAWSCAREERLERTAMSACDINVYINVIAP